ncbi:MAG: hypothetical protein B7X50_07985 [Alishewanella sp. 34-51-39]|nr:MAG: hypothetical protein B7X50_07985 [Alishewanella sp. 34-51-39]
MKNVNELINQLHEACKAEGIPILIMSMPEKQHVMMIKHSPKPEITSPKDLTPDFITAFSSSVLVDMAHERIVRLLNGERSKHEERGFEIIELLGVGLREVGVADEIH